MKLSASIWLGIFIFIIILVVKNNIEIITGSIISWIDAFSKLDTWHKILTIILAHCLWTIAFLIGLFMFTVTAAIISAFDLSTEFFDKIYESEIAKRMFLMIAIPIYPYTVGLIYIISTINRYIDNLEDKINKDKEENDFI